MTVSINRSLDVLTSSEVWALCRAHNELGLKTDQIGAAYVDDQPDPVLHAKEARTIVRTRPDLADVCNRILKAIGSAADGSRGNLDALRPRTERSEIIETQSRQ